MLWIPTKRQQITDENGKELTKGQYKVYCYLLLCGKQASGRDTFAITDEVGRMSVDAISKACNLGKGTVGTMLGDLYRAGLAIKKNREDHVGFVMFLPAQDCEYARVDEKKALKCFAYGAPDDAWGVYAMAHWSDSQFDMEKAYREIGACLGGVREDKVKWALDWLEDTGLVRTRMLWRDGRPSTVIELVQ